MFLTLSAPRRAAGRIEKADQEEVSPTSEPEPVGKVRWDQPITSRHADELIAFLNRGELDDEYRAAIVALVAGLAHTEDRVNRMSIACDFIDAMFIRSDEGATASGKWADEVAEATYIVA